MAISRNLWRALLAATAALSLCAAAPADELDSAEARAIARDAYIYGFPVVDNYRILHAYFVDAKSRDYKGPWNQLVNIPRVYTPQDKAVQTPNTDTPYSFVGLDLRAEPIVLTVPAIDKKRYFSLQFLDLYTHNFDYAGSRTTGNDGGVFLVVGPDWEGETPKGITKVIRSETKLALVGYRTQLFDPTDIEQVKAVQAGYKAEPLSKYLGQPGASMAPVIRFAQPLTPQQQRASAEFFSVLNFVLGLCPTHPSERELMARFAKIGVGAGLRFDANKLSPVMQAAMLDGIEDALKAQAEFKRAQVDTGKVTSGDLFGTREYLKNDYMARMSGAILGIYGNSKAEAMYPLYTVDAEGQKLDGARRYTLRFGPGELPPVNAFWSMTMYELPSSLLVANRLDRYLVNSPMLPNMKRDADGGLTLYLQATSPGPELEANWLPTPAGPFWSVLRLYWPQDAALQGRWTSPKLIAAK